MLLPSHVMNPVLAETIARDGFAVVADVLTRDKVPAILRELESARTASTRAGIRRLAAPIQSNWKDLPECEGLGS